MKKPLPIGISDFKELIDGGYTYIDKTLFIEEILEKGPKVFLIPRLRRFGKTLNLSMLRYFFEKSEEDTGYLFKGLNIWNREKYRTLQGQFPVIFITFKDIKHSFLEKTLEHFRALLSEEFERHRYLLDSDILSAEEKGDYRAILRKEESQLLCEQSLRLLIKWMHAYHKKAIILLIDEYDAPVHAAYVGKYYEPLIEFLRNLLSNCLKDSSHLKLGVLTGILRIAKESIFSGLNNVRPFTILNDSFQDKFGLLEQEVITLLANYGLSEKLSEIKEWFDGYRIGSCAGIYNPWSVLNCILDNGTLAPYWVNTSDNALMKQLMTEGTYDVKMDIEALLKGQVIERTIDEGIVFLNLKKNSDAVWSLLLYSGYVTMADTPLAYGTSCRLKIPNVEVRELYRSMVLQWFKESIQEPKYHMLLDSLTTGDVETFSQIFTEFILSSFSVFDVSQQEPEKVYHAFVLGILVGLKDQYEIKSNRESGYGRYDVILFPKNTKHLGIVMEFKKVESPSEISLETAADAAIQQIEEKEYAQELLDQGIHHILYLGFAFKGKKIHISHKFRK